ncbi:MAG: 3-deoxy-7-phosphoheptulonate synthase [Elusimicrobiota bacterium]
MEGQETGILAVCFDGDSFHKRIGPALMKWGLISDSDNRCRCFGPNFLTFRLESPIRKSQLEEVRSMPGARRTAMIDPRGMVVRRNGQPDIVVPLSDSVRVGGPEAVIIAGPCGVESESQICEIAEAVKEAGASALRGGAFKPRTSPYSFAGLRERGLEYLALARERTGLPIVTEALEPEDLDVVARYADAIQIGARNMQNFPLLFKAGQHPSGKPVLLKRGFGSTIDEFLQAAEYILIGRFCAERENTGLILCERGIRTYEQATRFMLDVGAFPVLKERSPFPVIADPSHPAGNRAYVPAMARAAVAAGADGLLIEVHTDPDRAWSDGAQTMDTRAFRRLAEEIRHIAELRPAAPLPR